MSEATTLEAPTEEVTPPSDADAVVAADAADLDGDAGKEEGASTPEAAAEAVTEEPPYEAALREAREAAEAAGREDGIRAANEQREADERQRQDYLRSQQESQRLQAAYRNRIGEAGQEAYDLAIEAGRSEVDATAARERAEQRFNTQHADGLKLYEPEALATARQEADTNLTREFRASIPQELQTRIADRFNELRAEGKPYGWRTVFADLVSFSREGLITATESKAQSATSTLVAIGNMERGEKVVIDKAALDADGNLEIWARLTGSSSGAHVNGGASTKEISYSQLLKMTDAQVDALPEGMVSEITAKAISEGK